MHYIGIDLALKYSHFCALNDAAEVIEKGRVLTTRPALTKAFAQREHCVICLEAGASSPWVDRLLRELGHEVVVCNPRRVRLIAQSTSKSDEVDAETLARLVRADRRLLRPVTHRSEQTMLVRARLRSRSAIVKARTTSINTVRGLLRSFGYKVARCAAENFTSVLRRMELTEEVTEMVKPLITNIDQLTGAILSLDHEIEQICRVYSETQRLQSIPGVGPIVSLSFMLCLEDATRFKRSREVGGFLGLRPSMRASGERSTKGRITKEGDRAMRWLLLQAAHALLQSKQDCELKRWAQGLAARVGKKKAVVALARKIAVLMHHLWVSGETFNPFPTAERSAQVTN